MVGQQSGGESANSRQILPSLAPVVFLKAVEPQQKFVDYCTVSRRITVVAESPLPPKKIGAGSQVT